MLRRLGHRARFVADDLVRLPRSWRWRLWSPQRVRLHGVVLVDDERLGRRARQELRTGRYERGEAFALHARLGAEDRVVELGTGIGLLAILAARRVGSERVTTYEPNPRLLPLIRENCRLNHVEPQVVHGAVGVGRGSTVLHLGDDHQSASTHGETGSDAKSVEVPLFDAAEEVHRHQPTFLIVDVEGSEREIVSAIDWSPVEKILLELHPQRFEPGDEDRIRDHLLAEGFRVDPIVSSRRKLFLSR